MIQIKWNLFLFESSVNSEGIETSEKMKPLYTCLRVV